MSVTQETIGEGDPRLFLQERGLEKIVQYDLPPMMGASRHRNEPTINDASGNAEIVDDGGELKLHLGANGGDEIDFPASLFSQYRSGTYGDTSMGVRIPEPLSGSQKVLWGAFNDDAGAGWGVDSDGLFTFWREGGEDRIYRADSPTDGQDWNRQPPESIDISDGHIFHLLQQMYGHGPFVWYAKVKDEATQSAPVKVFDQRVFPGRINVEDFNKPIRVEVKNNGTADTLDFFLAGRQYTLWGDQGKFEKRTPTEIIKSYTTSTTGWEPVIAIQKKPTFPPGTGRENSVRCVVEQIAARAGDDAEIRYTQEASVSNDDSQFLSQSSMKDPADTAVETIIDDGGTNGNEYTSTTNEITVGSDKGDQLAHGFLTGGKFSAEPVQETAQVPLGQATQGVLWVRTEVTGVSIDAALRTGQQY